MERHRRHDVSDEVWALLEPHLPGRAGSWGGLARDNRLFINAVFWILRSGALPADLGHWKNVHRRFCRWRDKGVWEKLLEKLIDDPDDEWFMIEASHLKVHAHATGAVGGNQAIGRTKVGSTAKYIWPWMRMVCRSEPLSRQLPRRIAQRLQNSSKTFNPEIALGSVFKPQKFNGGNQF